VLPRLGSIGSNACEPGSWNWEPVCQWFPILGNRNFSKQFVFGQNYFYYKHFLVSDVGLVNTCHMFFEEAYFFKYIISYCTWLANMFGLITRLLFAAGHSWYVYCERIDGTGPISKTQRLFLSNMFFVSVRYACFHKCLNWYWPIKQNKDNVFHTASFTCAFDKKYMYKHNAASFTCAFDKNQNTCINTTQHLFTCAFNQNQNTCINSTQHLLHVHSIKIKIHV